MRVRHACFIKYCRAKKVTEKLKIHAEHKVLKNEFKMKTKQAKKKYYQELFEKTPQMYQQLGKLFALLSI